MVVLDKRYRRRSVKMISGKYGERWAAVMLRMLYAFQLDGKANSSAQAIHLTKNSDSFTEIVRCEATFADNMQGQLS